MPAHRQDHLVLGSCSSRSAARHIVVWLSVFLLLPKLSSGQPNAICNAACQAQQETALQALFTTANIPIVPQQTGAMQQPVQCSWRGITCCNSNYTLDLTQGFPSTVAVPCTVSLSVVAVLAWGSSTSPGQLPDQQWGSLANTLTYLDLTGISC